MKLELPEYNYCPLCSAPVTVVHREGRHRPVCTRCGHIIYVNPYPAACLVVIRSSRALLTLRSIEPHQGEWCLPGGFLEWGESPEEGARRELLEETGLAAGRLSIIGAYDSITGLRRHVLLLAYFVREWAGNPVAGDDAAEVKWFDLNAIPPLAFKVHEQVLADARKAGYADESAGG
ncbi:MAG: NUDIX domain-containing protein [Candidatus Latescibacterota bacterium]